LRVVQDTENDTPGRRARSAFSKLVFPAPDGAATT
jgi:hypothetical protein